MANASPEYFAAQLLRIGAVSLSPANPYTWASGLRSPIYCDNRMTLGHPTLRSAIADAFAAHIEATGWNPELVAGTATAGIPHAAWLADRMNRPMVYVRSKAKGHGRRNQIEGPLKEGQSTVLVEDLVSTGMSSLAAVGALQEADATVMGVVAIFSYGFPKAHQQFADADIPLITLTNYDVLIREAITAGVVDAGQAETLKAWQADPVAWSEQWT